MKAPEKIYVSTDPFGFLHAYDCENHPPIVEEYIRKDAFIEKACDAYCRLCDTKECGDTGECEWVEKFRKRLMR